MTGLGSILVGDFYFFCFLIFVVVNLYTGRRVQRSNWSDILSGWESGMIKRLTYIVFSPFDKFFIFALGALFHTRLNLVVVGPIYTRDG